MPRIKRNIEEGERFEKRIKNQRKANRFRVIVIVGITIVIIMVVLAWALITGY